MYVPALLGLGTPAWDYGARGALFGLTRGTGRAEIVRAVLEGIAQRGADLVEAAEADSGIAIPALRVDGGMTDNDDVRAGARRRRAAAGRDLADARGDVARRGAHGRARGRSSRIRSTTSRRRGSRASASNRSGSLDRDRWRDAIAPRPRAGSRSCQESISDGDVRRARRRARATRADRPRPHRRRPATRRGHAARARA